MDEREVTCSKCENSTTIVRDSVQSGWIFQEPGWALVNYSYFCPQCNEDRLRKLKINNIEEEE